MPLPNFVKSYFGFLLYLTYPVTAKVAPPVVRTAFDTMCEGNILVSNANNILSEMVNIVRILNLWGPLRISGFRIRLKKLTTLIIAERN